MPDDDDRIERYDGAPPIETLRELCGNRCPNDPEVTAQKIAALLNDKADPCEVSDKCRTWVAQCYHKPRRGSHEMVLCAIDDLLGGFGVEALTIPDAKTYTDNGIRMCPPFSYVNMGDSYACTLARDHKESKWVVADTAALTEEYEKENDLGDHKKFATCPERCEACHADEDSIELTRFGQDNIFYAWVCVSCNHHHETPDDFVPDDEDEPEEDEPV